MLLDRGFQRRKYRKFKAEKEEQPKKWADKVTDFRLALAI
jgi:hypothetical protein